ncbi:MAG: hypothetical protein HY261_10515 [Chloroflexi bacterium]|nr:hypothetical protein [Chloroflexota bacterium]
MRNAQTTRASNGHANGHANGVHVLHWYVAKVHRGRESQLRQQLQPEGIEVYHPQIVVHKDGRRRTEALFPSYLFCKGDPSSDAWVHLRRAHGLKYLLGGDNAPTPVEDAIVETIQKRVESWNAGGWRDIFKPGDRVLLNAGPFKGIEAVFVRYLPARERCKILIATLARQHEMEVPVAMMAAPGGTRPLKPSA